jgi:hypothetical protein
VPTKHISRQGATPAQKFNMFNIGVCEPPRLTCRPGTQQGAPLGPARKRHTNKGALPYMLCAARGRTTAQPGTMTGTAFRFTCAGCNKEPPLGPACTIDGGVRRSQAHGCTWRKQGAPPSAQHATLVMGVCTAPGRTELTCTSVPQSTTQCYC